LDLRDRRDLYNGFGNGLSRAFELALTPAIFSGIGWAVDRVLGTTPLFMILLLLLAVAGVGYMTWFRYEAEMREREAEAVWSRSRPVPRATPGEVAGS
jgi:F0F1-type ATP synthase assembly protein I